MHVFILFLHTICDIASTSQTTLIKNIEEFLKKKQNVSENEWIKSHFSEDQWSNG